MAISNYGQLKTAVATWLDRADLAAVVADFITLAETRIYLTHPAPLRVRAMESNVSAGTLPTGFLRVRAATESYGGSVRELRYLAPEQYAQHTAGPWYSIVGGALVTTSTGTATFTVYTRLPSMSVDGDTNWLLTNAPSVYLWGALMEAAIFNKDDAALAKYAPLFDQAIRAVNAADGYPAPAAAQVSGITVV